MNNPGILNATPQVPSFKDLEPASIVAITQATALACYPWIGRGDEHAADAAAVAAMRTSLNSLKILGRVAIGEGERDEAPMLYIGEVVGLGGVEVDIALDPLEGTTLCAHAANNSLSVIAVTERGDILHAPDVYMEKIAVGGNLPIDVVDLNNTPKRNLQNLANAKKVSISDLVVCVLNRSRHEELVEKLREAGARVKLITDGDVMAALATAIADCNIDMYIGIGGAPEGVLAAAALRPLGGQIQGRLIFKAQEEKKRAQHMGIVDLSRIYSTEEMVSGDVIFAATGVTSGDFLKGIRKEQGDSFTCHSLSISSASGVISYHQDSLPALTP